MAAVFDGLGPDTPLQRASWEQNNWSGIGADELTAAFDTNWAALDKSSADETPSPTPAQRDAMILAEKISEHHEAKGTQLNEADLRSATLDSVRAVMMIRAYRVRGHRAANLDPLGIEKPNITLSWIRLLMASPKQIWTALFSLIICSGWKPPPCAK